MRLTLAFAVGSLVALVLCTASAGAASGLTVGVPKPGDFTIASLYVTAKGVPGNNDAQLRAKLSGLPQKSGVRLYSVAFAAADSQSRPLKGGYWLRVIAINPRGGRSDLPVKARLSLIARRARALRIHHAHSFVVLEGYIARAGVPRVPPPPPWPERDRYCQNAYRQPDLNARGVKGLPDGPWLVAGRVGARPAEKMHKRLHELACAKTEAQSLGKLKYFQSLGIDWPRSWGCAARSEFYLGPGAGAAAGVTVRRLRVFVTCKLPFVDVSVEYFPPYPLYYNASERKVTQAAPQLVLELAFDRDMTCDDVRVIRLRHVAVEVPPVHGRALEPPVMPALPPGC